MRRAAALFLVFSLFAVPCVFSVPLEDLVAAAHAARLRSDGASIIETQLSNPAPALLPRDNQLRQIVSGAISSLNPNMLVEALHLYVKPSHLNTASGGWTDAHRTDVLNQMLGISSMTGLQYYSASRKAMRVFYEQSYVIDGPDSKNRIPDPVFSLLPESYTLYARQKDLTFGDNIYRFDYVTTQDTVYISQENITSMTIAFIPVINRGNLQTITAVIDCGDSLLIYAVSMARAFSIPVIWERLSNSFTNRAEAVLGWFTGRLDSALLTP